MKEIPLTQGKVAIVDDEDFELLSQWKWHYSSAGYATRAIQANGKKRFILMHRLIMNTPVGMETDHINHNGLDNRKSNMRICTLAQNHLNILKNKRNTSGFKGVSWEENRNAWRACIELNGKGTKLGRFKSPQDAARAYDKAARELFGEFAFTNFPD